jgi:hypothetical protein
MSKRYVSYRSDLADKTALDAAILGNEVSWPVGTLVVCADGLLYIVSANDGSSATTIAVGAQTVV